MNKHIRRYTTGNSMACVDAHLKFNTTTVANPMLIKLITADPCALSLTRLMAILDAFANTNDSPI